MKKHDKYVDRPLHKKQKMRKQSIADWTKKCGLRKLFLVSGIECFYDNIKLLEHQYFKVKNKIKLRKKKQG